MNWYKWRRQWRQCITCHAIRTSIKLAAGWWLRLKARSRLASLAVWRCFKQRYCKGHRRWSRLSLVDHWLRAQCQTGTFSKIPLPSVDDRTIVLDQSQQGLEKPVRVKCGRLGNVPQPGYEHVSASSMEHDRQIMSRAKYRNWVTLSSEKQ